MLGLRQNESTFCYYSDLPFTPSSNGQRRRFEPMNENMTHWLFKYKLQSNKVLHLITALAIRPHPIEHLWENGVNNSPQIFLYCY
jgi:hypothetical protein